MKSSQLLIYIVSAMVFVVFSPSSAVALPIGEAIEAALVGTIAGVSAEGRCLLGIISILKDCAYVKGLKKQI